VFMLDNGLVSDLEVVQTCEDIRFRDGRHFGKGDSRAFVVRCKVGASCGNESPGGVVGPGVDQVVMRELVDVGTVDSAADSTECGAESA
jgi:hypothetical protein